MTALAPSMQAYFTDRLIGQRSASPNTIAAYRDTFRLLLRFANGRTGTPPSQLDIAQLDAPLTAAFLEHLQRERGNQAATRNNRLAAIHSLFAYLALHHPEHAASIQRVLAIPPKRTERNLLTYLTDPEVDALLSACDQATWTGRRDHAMLALTIQTGLRISELISLNCQDVTLTTGANVHTVGKGRKERRTPLIPATRTMLKAWLHERAGTPDQPLFPTTTGKRLSRDAIERRLAIHLATAAASCPSIASKHITMHTLRHTAAMRLLLAGNDITVIALWLGHEQITTTQIYLHADMTHKQQAIDRTKPLAAKPGRYQPPDALLAFLEALPLCRHTNARRRSEQDLLTNIGITKTSAYSWLCRRRHNHECRHTFASLMIAAGVNAKALSTFLGHASVTITLDRYGHLFPGTEKEAAGLLDSYLERSVGGGSA